MKELFFTFVAISLPVLALGGLVYMFVNGMYRIAQDWLLARELRELRTETERRRHDQPATDRPTYDPLVAFDDNPPAPESEGIATLPLDPDWRPPIFPFASSAISEADVGANDSDTPVSNTAGQEDSSPGVTEVVDKPILDDETASDQLPSEEPAAAPSDDATADDPSTDDPAVSEPDDWPNRTLD